MNILVRALSLSIKPNCGISFGPHSNLSLPISWKKVWNNMRMRVKKKDEEKSADTIWSCQLNLIEEFWFLFGPIQTCHYVIMYLLLGISVRMRMKRYWKERGHNLIWGPVLLPESSHTTQDTWLTTLLTLLTLLLVLTTLTALLTLLTLLT